ncbi:glycosyltransferase family 4 protein [Pediococcus claussenii]|uniref:Glycosyl transferases group 1 family protein n=1 Tax=Pediococcus claussenii (strain ATCC BAA-344 / DSM 14800 / JCM 18046 / KCTC 3811 / LMG 21948 / P06) TaxID=701521 RepID=G8PDX0_PEDCP|nr:glycosyltransferase family 4 protein [Pediococcus claussenii]AEV95455.1 glycosyl transferases group 1 family protein [Pediococcus claussenii ATCC BAA-344]ANZ68981.1 1,2-diacylglycerol 3-glucosyltransferase [Pediococcus claussenii]ANZ70797.1 1,2-diacylglycerol 3-glucosyltransferase [Pediococcus claussenii]
MNIGLFTDTYFPQVSGVATSIKTLRDQLEKQGHQVYIFTTTDPKVDKNVYERNVFRFPSVPFVSFTDRRIAVSGFIKAAQVAKELNLDIVHTQTEFSLGWMGKFVAKSLKIPCIHTYHTMYEDYLHYVANGKVLRPYHVKQMTRAFCYHMNGIVAPSVRVSATLQGYGVKTPIRIIPTGVNLDKFSQKKEHSNWRVTYGYDDDTFLLLSLSRLAYEKNIKEVIDILPSLIKEDNKVELLIVGDGPARDSLESQAKELGIERHVRFAGEIDNDQVYQFYQMADLFISASDSESQGLTYIEALASGLKVVAKSGPYTDQLLDNKNLGMTFDGQDEFVHEVEEYMNNPTKYVDQAPRSEKLYEISADYFGKRVLDFYKDSIESYSNMQTDSDLS